MAIGVWGGVSGLGVALGPVIGGAVVDGISWEAIFWINVPVAVVAIPLVLWALPESYGRRQPLDLAGLALAGAGILALVWAIIRGNDDGWGSVTRRRRHACSAPLLLVAFLVRESRTDHPLVPLRLFRVRSFAVANGSALVFSFGVFGLVFLLAQYLQIGMGYTPLEAGIRTLPWTAAPMIFAPIAGMLAPRDRASARCSPRASPCRPPASPGMGLVVTSDGLVYADLVPGLALAGIGMGLTFAPSATAVLVRHGARRPRDGQLGELDDPRDRRRAGRRGARRGVHRVGRHPDPRRLRRRPAAGGSAWPRSSSALGRARWCWCGCRARPGRQRA